jgi:lactoylglutathione lyase
VKYLHTMVRVSNLEASLDFYCRKLGLVERRRTENEKGRFTLVFLAAPDDTADSAPLVELTYNWDPETLSGARNFGHLAYSVANIYETCQRLADAGVTINRPPRDGRMAFVRSPDGISIELPPAEPWASMPSTGSW